MKLARDTNSGALVNTDNEAYIARQRMIKYATQSQQIEMLQLWCAQLEQRIKELEDKLNGNKS